MSADRQGHFSMTNGLPVTSDNASDEQQDLSAAFAERTVDC
jgi:hypothetical protein